MTDLIDRKDLIELIDKVVKDCKTHYNAELSILYLKEFIDHMPSQSLSDEITDKMLYMGKQAFRGTNGNLYKVLSAIYKAMQEAREPIEKQWLRQLDVLDELKSLNDFIDSFEEGPEEKADAYQSVVNIREWVKEQKKPVD